jgi:hypothetical protein
VKRSFLVQIAVYSALVIGCSRTNELKWHQAEGKSQAPPTRIQQAQMSPEFVISHMESPKETARYLQGLAKDANFNPKEHAEMLKTYAGDSNAEVASAAKELANRAQ